MQIYVQIADATPGWSHDGSESEYVGGHNGGNNAGDTSDDTYYEYIDIPMPSAVGTIGVLYGGHFCCKTKSFYFVDLFGDKMFRYCEETDNVYWAVITGVQGSPAFVIPIAKQSGKFIVGCGHSVYKVEWDGESTTATAYGTIATVEEGTNSTMNYGIAGPRGDLYFGTLDAKLCGTVRFKS